MKKALILLALMAIATPAMAQQHVNGYYRDNGYYVQGYYRSTPNNTQYDNYSTKGNFNPYTGKKGTINVNTTPSRNYGYNYGRTNYNNPYGN